MLSLALDGHNSQKCQLVFFRWAENHGRTNSESDTPLRVDEGRKRVVRIMAAILASLHMRTADDLFGPPQGSPRRDKLIAASVHRVEKIMEKIDERCSPRNT